jgi:hypothetical protein
MRGRAGDISAGATPSGAVELSFCQMQTLASGGKPLKATAE